MAITDEEEAALNDRLDRVLEDLEECSATLAEALAVLEGEA
jgi:hypothetical protein